VPFAFVVGAVGTAALARGNLSCNKFIDDLVDGTLDAKEDLDIVLTEEIDRPWAHSAGEDVRYFVAGKKDREFSGFVPGAFKDFFFGNLFVLYGKHCVFQAVPEVCGDHVSLFCNSDFHGIFLEMFWYYPGVVRDYNYSYAHKWLKPFDAATLRV
jgi:hypothetical protein